MARTRTTQCMRTTTLPGPSPSAPGARIVDRVRRLSPRLASLGLVLVVVLATAGSRAPQHRLASTLLLRVIDSATRLPLPNAEITAQGRRGLTNAAGQMRILWPESGELRVRIRQLGFRYVERTFTRDRASRAEEDTAVVALARTGWALPQVVVRAQQRCRSSGDPARVALSEASMEVLRFGAEQFENFRRAYPFDFTLERRTSSTMPGRTVRPRLEREPTASSDWGDRYTPGKVVVTVGPNEYFVPLLFVAALADSAFWENHCLDARGVESRDGRRLIRLDFSPALDVRDTEWEGTAWLDSARSVLARVDFRLTNLRRSEGPQRFDGYTVFSTPTPYIAMPDSTFVRWTIGVPSGPYGEMRSWDAVQSLVMRDLRYREGTPPEAR